MDINFSMLKQTNPSIFLMTFLILSIGGVSFLFVNPLYGFAQSNSTDISNMSIGEITTSEPFFVESGTITNVKDFGDNKTEFTYSGNGTLNGNISVITNGTIATSLIGGTIEYGKGSGQATTSDGRETASYDIIYIQNI